MTSDLAAAGPGALHTSAGIRAAGVVAVLRAPTAEHFVAIGETLVDLGITALEVTLTSDGGLAAIEQLASRLGEHAHVGAGTVLTAADVEHCLNAGAAFVVAPTTSPDVVAAARIADIAVYPGALSPSEIQTASRMGATAVKVFPASLVGPGYIKDIHAPFPDIDIMATGGITIESLPDWFIAGVVAVGLGSPLLGNAGKTGPDAPLRRRARRCVEALDLVLGRK